MRLSFLSFLLLAPAALHAQALTHTTRVHDFFKAGIIVDDLDATLARLRERGVPIASGPFPARDGQRANATIRDNAGNFIQLFERSR